MPNTSYNAAEADARDRLTFFAAQQRMAAGRPQYCPRCGKFKIKPSLMSNATARGFAGIYVCDQCGNIEAVKQANGEPDLLSGWAAAKNPDFRVEAGL